MQQNVLGFDIPVYHVLIVHELDSMADLLHHLADLFFDKSALFSQRGVHIATEARLKDQVQVFLVAEEGVQLDYVGVVQEALDLHFSDKLVYEAGLAFKYFFGDFFQGADEVAFFMSR